jgi:lysophospholipase
MLTTTLLSTLLLVSSTLALPQALDEARAAVILNILEKADRDGQDVGLVARQLFGGNDEYAPYEIPCPSDYTWVRPADVSDHKINRRVAGQIWMNTDQ